MNKKQAVILLISSFTLLGLGCGKTASEKLIERQTGGQVKVNEKNGNVKVDIGAGGTFESGVDVKLPDDFPKDIYVIEGKITAAIVDGSKKNYSISVDSTKGIEEISTLYQQKFKADGWKITGTMNFGDSSSVVAEKNGDTVSILIGKNGDKNSVVISVNKK
ncbi:MAG: hypothetical protein WC725_01385 [Patescibacteria group bacterium]|jgi:hypothetical protein